MKASSTHAVPPRIGDPAPLLRALGCLPEIAPRDRSAACAAATTRRWLDDGWFRDLLIYPPSVLAKYARPRPSGRSTPSSRLSGTPACRSFAYFVPETSKPTNCVAARRGGEQLEVNRRSATQVNPIRPAGAASLLLVVKPRTEREPVAHRVLRGRRGKRGWLGAERREGGVREAGRPDRGSVTRRKVTRSGVRAPIRATKRRNGRFAAGGREVEP